jgi:putative spermidine/putrescine transport system permease protein
MEAGRDTFRRYGPLLAPALLVVLVTVGVALVLLVRASFMPGSGPRPTPGWSLTHYQALVSDPFFVRVLFDTLAASCLVTLLTAIVGFPIAYSLARSGERMRRLKLILQLFVMLGLARTFTGLMIGHVLITLPYVVRNMTAAFVLFDPALEQAARNLRASSLQIVRRVTVPVMLPSILSSAIFAFVTSFGNLTVSIFLTGPRLATLPVQIFVYVDQSLDPSVAAVSAIVIFVTLAVVLLIERLVGLQRFV